MQQVELSSEEFDKQWDARIAQQKKSHEAFIKKASPFQRELQKLRPDDQIQGMNLHERYLGYWFISTAGHGFLVVSRGDRNIRLAGKLSGYKGKLAMYLEEDGEIPNFLAAIKAKELLNVE